MDTITNYVDLCRKIDTIETQLLQVDVDLGYWYRRGRLSRKDKTVLKGNIEELYNKKLRLRKMHNFYLDIRKEKEERIKNLKDLNDKIARMKYLENKSYKQIVDELNNVRSLFVN